VLTRLPMLCLALLVACGSTEDIESDPHQGDLLASDHHCEVLVDRISGTDDSHPVRAGVDVLVELIEPASGWDAWIEGVPGVTVHDHSGDAAVVRPDQALVPGHEYTLWVRDCAGNEVPHALPVGAR